MRPVGSVLICRLSKFEPTSVDVVSTTGASPVTMTSAEVEGRNVTSSVAVFARETVTVRWTCAKPASVAVSVYVPGGRRTRR